MLVLAVLVCPLALADDVDMDDFNIDLDDVNIDGAGGATTVTYSGGHTERKGEIGTNIPITISHLGGPVTVRCTDGDQISARVDFEIEGTTGDKAKAFGDGIGISVYGDKTQGGAKTRVPAKSSSIVSTDIPFVVSVPLQAKLTVTAQDGPITVSNCTGTLKASTSKGGISVEGAYSAFTISAASGDVKVELRPDNKVTAASSISAPKGNVTLKMSRNANNNLDASGSEVIVDHLVTGTTGPTRVAGQVGAGGPAIKITAPKGVVTVGMSD